MVWCKIIVFDIDYTEYGLYYNKGGSEMRRSRAYTWLLTLLLISALSVTGCGGSGGGSAQTEPLQTQDISGVWLGYIAHDSANIITTGMITDEGDTIFVGQDSGNHFSQYTSRSGYNLSVAPNSSIFSGYLDLCTWDTSGPGPDYGCSIQSGYIEGVASTKSALGLPFGATYTVNNIIETFLAFYSKSYDNAPALSDIQGDWVIPHAWKFGNTLTLHITTDATNNVSGSDGRSNQFTGTISIHTSSRDKNVYDLNLLMTKQGVNPITFEGLATYISQESTNGISVSNNLVIGATNSTKTYSLSGLATRP